MDNESLLHAPPETERLGVDLAPEPLETRITRQELDARFSEIKTRIWITAAGAFLGSAIGSSLKAGITPHTAAEMVWRLL